MTDEIAVVIDHTDEGAKLLRRRWSLQTQDSIDCPFPVPDKFRDLFKRELDKLVNLGVLRPVKTSAWAFPTFLAPKKDGTARFVSDFRKLNAILKSVQYPMPLIKEVLTRREGFDYVTILDLTSQFYHFGITPRARKLCTITTPFGLYEYCRLPMGIKNSPAFAQGVMESILRDYAPVECFIDDIGIFTSGSFADHVTAVKNVLSEMNNANFSIKPKKCFQAVKEVEYLGHIITCDGIKTQPKKIARKILSTTP